MSSYLLDTTLAVWGAILSTAAIAWNIIRDLRDRADIRLNVMVGSPITHEITREIAAFKSAGSLEEATHLIVSITNHGRRAALITKLILMRRDFSHVGHVVPHTLPKLLKENEFTLEHTDDLECVRTGFDRIYAVDSMRRNWDLSNEHLRELNDRLMELGLMSKQSPMKRALEGGL